MVHDAHYFVAPWAEATCRPHRQEVGGAARELGLSVRDADVDQEAALVQEYHVLNVPAVAIEGDVGSLLVGAFPADVIVARLKPRL